MTDGVGKRVRKNTGIMLSAKGIAAFMALAGLAFAARGLTTEEFGLLVFLHAFTLFFTEIATFQSWLAVIGYAAKGLTGAEVEDLPHFGRVVRFCVTLDLVAALTAFTAALSLAYLLSDWIGILDDASPYLFFYAFVILLNQKSASTGVLRLYNRFDLIALNQLIIPGGRMIGSGIAWAMGAPLEYYLLAWFIASATSYLMLPVQGIREMRRQGVWQAVCDGKLSLRAPAQGLWRFVALTNLDKSVAAGGSSLPVLLAGSIGGAGFAAIFRIAQEVAIVLAKGARMIDKVLYPEFTALIARGEGHRVPLLVIKTGVAMLAIGSAIGLAFWFFGPSVLAFALGEAYATASVLAVLLILAASISASVAPLFPALYAAGIPGRAVMARVTGLVAMIIGFIGLFYLIGMNGTGFAMIIASLMTVVSATIIAVGHDWSDVGIQDDESSFRTDPASTSTVSDKTGGPGQPGSDKS